MMEMGWVPEKKTDLGNVVVDESILSEIDMPEAQLIARYMMLQKRIAQVDSWLDAINPETGRVHGKVMTLRTITGRMAHATPNMAQVPAVYSPYGPECRRLWVPGNPRKQNLVGIDASSIELRMLCHYMNDPEYTEIVVSGDIHTERQRVTLAAERGFIKGLDGRRLFIRSPHAALNTQLQGAAAVVMDRDWETTISVYSGSFM